MGKDDNIKKIKVTKVIARPTYTLEKAIAKQVKIDDKTDEEKEQLIKENTISS